MLSTASERWLGSGWLRQSRRLPVQGGRWKAAGPGKEMPISNTRKCYTINTRFLIESLQRKKYPVALLASKPPFLIYFYLIPTVIRQKSFKKKEDKPLNQHKLLQAVYSPSKSYSHTALTFPIFFNKLDIETRFFHVCFLHVTKIRKEQKITSCTKTHRHRGTFLSVCPISNPWLAHLTWAALKMPATWMPILKLAYHGCNSSIKSVKSHRSVCGPKG